MYLERLSACLAILTLAACRTIDAPLDDDGGDSDGSSSAATDDPTAAEGSATVGTTTADPTGASTTMTTTSADTTGDDGDAGDGPSTVTDPDETGDPQDTSSDGGTTDDPTDESTGEVEPMPCGSTCLSAPGGEWSAPVRLAIGDTQDAAPGCEGAWGLAVDELYSELVAPPADCGCSCGDAQDVTCSETMTMHRKANNANACAVAPILESYPITPGCNAIGETDQDTRWDLAVPSPQGGSCDPIAEVLIEPAAFATRYTLCGESAPAQGECNGDQTCVADSDAPLCVYAEGDLACPGDGFGVKHLVYTDELVDDRSCTECSCGNPVGTCVTAGVDIFDYDANCVPSLFNPPIDMPSAGCVVSDFAVYDVHYPESAVPEPQTTCTPSASNAQGDVSAPGVMTLCCNG